MSCHVACSYSETLAEVGLIWECVMLRSRGNADMMLFWQQKYSEVNIVTEQLNNWGGLPREQVGLWRKPAISPCRASISRIKSINKTIARREADSSWKISEQFSRRQLPEAEVNWMIHYPAGLILKFIWRKVIALSLVQSDSPFFSTASVSFI